MSAPVKFQTHHSDRNSDKRVATPPAADSPQADPYDLSSLEREHQDRLAADIEATQPTSPSGPARDPNTGKFTAPAKHSDLTLYFASQLGLGESDLEGMTPAAAERYVKTLHARQVGAGDGRRQPPEAPPPPSPAAPAPAKFEHGLSELNATPEIVAAIDRLHAHFQGQLDGLRREVQDRETARQAQTALQRIGGQLAKKRPDLFGAEPHAADPTTPEGARFQSVVGHVRTLFAQKKATTPEKDADAALALIFGAAAPKPAAEPTTPQADAWSQAGLSIPTQRSPAPEPKGTRAAERMVAQIQRETALANGSAIDLHEEFGQ